MAHADKFLLAGVMGWPVMHSRSPMIHNHWFKTHALAGTYVPLAIEPQGLAAALIDRFGTALRAALKDPTIVARMTELGGDIVPEARQTPEGLRSWLKPEIDKWGALIRAAGSYAD